MYDLQCAFLGGEISFVIIVIPVRPCRSTVINSPVPGALLVPWEPGLEMEKRELRSRPETTLVRCISWLGTILVLAASQPPTLDEKHFGSTIADVFGFSLQQHGVRQSSSGGKVVRCGASVCLWPKKTCRFVMCLFGSSHQKTSVGMSCSSLLVRSGYFLYRSWRS